MAFQRVSHGGGAIDTTLNSSIGSTDVSLVLDAATGWPDGSNGPFYIVVGRDLPTEEKVLVTSRSGNTLSGCTRGVDGTSAAAHVAGELVGHVFTAVEADEANQAVAATLGAVTTKGDLLVATGAGTLDNLTVGADGQLLLADSSQATGLKYGALPVNSVGASQITDGSVGTSELADSSVTSAKLATSVWHYGNYSGTTDSVGALTFSHGASFTPSNVQITSDTIPPTGNVTCSLYAFTVSTITVRYIQANGSGLSASAVSGYFLCLP